MKQYITLLTVFILTIFTFCSCGGVSPYRDDPGTTPPTTQGASDAAETTAESTVVETTVAELETLPLSQDPMKFSFMSGAGGWATVLTLHADGSFTGYYQDSEMGERSKDYPDGTVYVCAFSGRFENIEQVDDHSYQMTLADVQTEQPTGEEWIEDGVRYVASEPYGIYQGEVFVFYLPDTPVDAVSQDLLSWWPYRYEQVDNPRDTLSCYGILNVTTGDGFFSAE